MELERVEKHHVMTVLTYGALLYRLRVLSVIVYDRLDPLCVLSVLCDHIQYLNLVISCF